MFHRAWGIGLALALAGAVGAQELSLLGLGDGGSAGFQPSGEILFGVNPRKGLPPWTLNRFLDAEPDRGQGFDPARDVLPITNGGSAVNPGGSCWGIVSLQSAFYSYVQRGRALPAGLTGAVPELAQLVERGNELGHCGLRSLVDEDRRAAELAQVAAGKLMASQAGFPKPSPALDAGALTRALEADGYAMIAFALPTSSPWWHRNKGYPTHAVQIHGAPRRVELTGGGGRRVTGTFFAVADSNSEWQGGRDNGMFGLVKLDGAREATKTWTWVGAPVGRQRLCQDCYQPDEYYQDAGHLWLVPTRYWETGERDQSGRPEADYIWSRPEAPKP